MIPDLTSPTCMARGVLAKLGIKRDPAGTGPDDLLFDVDVAHMLDADPADRARLDAMIPGAAALVASAATSSRKVRLSDSVDRGTRFLSVSDGATGGLLVAGRKAEVRDAVLRIAGPLATLTVRYRVLGMDPAEVPGLLRVLDKDVDTDVQTAQQSLTATPGVMPTRPSASGRGWQGGGGGGGVGLVVCASIVVAGGGRREVCGVVTAVSADPAGMGGEVLTIEDTANGDVPVFAVTSDVAQTVTVCPPDGRTVADVLAEYQQRAAMAAVPASWVYLVQAASVALAGGQLHAGPAGEWTLDENVLATAVELSKTEARRGA